MSFVCVAGCAVKQVPGLLMLTAGVNQALMVSY